MKKNLTPWLTGSVFFYCGCSPRTIPAYITSPFDVNSNYYHSIPLKSDSIKSAVYTNFAFTAGSSNYSGDELYAFHAGIHRSHNFGKFQAYYGAGLALGSYNVENYYRVKYTGGIYTGYTADTLGHIPSSHNFFGAYGFNGGLNYVLPFKHKRGEWRFGIQTSFQNEFGKYLSFRKSLPDSVIDILATDRWTKQVGISSEWIRRKRSVEMGYKIAAGLSFPTDSHYIGDSSHGKPFYISNTIQLTKGKITGFCQVNAGSHTTTFQTGINYRLRKKAPKQLKAIHQLN
jgi:hypothetical protein